MTKRLLYILILMTATTLTAAAQTDLPLYFNVVSDDIDAQSDTSTLNAGHDPRAPKIRQPKSSADTIAPGEDIGSLLRILQSLYLAGKYDDALRLSQSIRETRHLNSDDENDRLKYTIAALKDMEYDDKADSLTKRFLGKNPFFNPKSSDPVSFKENLSNYYTMPRFSAWIGVGGIVPIPIIDTVHVVIDTLNPEPDYSNASGFALQLGFEYHPLKFLSLSFAPTYTRYQFSREIQRRTLTKFCYEETDNILTLPIRAEAYLYTRREKWVPSIYVGVKAKCILKSKYSAYNQTVGEAQYTPSAKGIDLDEKTKFNYAGTFGLKLSRNHQRITYFMDLSMSMDFKPFNNPARNTDNNELVYDKMYVPDIFHMAEMSLMGGIKINFFYKTVARYGYGH